MNHSNSIDPRRVVLVIVAIILTLIIIGLSGCESEYCWNCVTTETVTLNVEYLGYPRTKTTETVLCMTEKEIRVHEKEVSGKEVFEYDVEGNTLVMTTIINVICSK